MTGLRASTVLVLSLFLGAVAQAQESAGSSVTAAAPVPLDCPYARCALSIVPAWNGLLLVRGAESQHLGNLNFFWPRPISWFVTGDSAQVSARNAFVTRRRAAVLTDFGGLLLLSGAVAVARRGEFSGTPRTVAVVGATMFAISVPLHFAADGWMSRAVWWHNAGFSR